LTLGIYSKCHAGICDKDHVTDNPEEVTCKACKDILSKLDDESEQKELPVRLCCGERHLGFVCSDGNVMCCLCFDRVSQDDLKVLPSGMKENVCKTCARLEQEMAKQRNLENGK
jgi:hypothetical protein